MTRNESAVVLGTGMRYEPAELVDPQVDVVAKASNEVLSTLAK